MYCTRCGFELREGDRFCSRCGIRTEAATPWSHPLRLDKQNKKIAGVCAGFARYLGVDVVLMRVLWLGIALCTGVGFLVYLAAWIVVPNDYGDQPLIAAPQNQLNHS
jgi:phage shock protein C